MYLKFNAQFALPWLLFLVYAAMRENPQNVCVCALVATIKRQVAPACLLQTYSTFSKSVMMSFEHLV